MTLTTLFVSLAFASEEGTPPPPPVVAERSPEREKRVRVSIGLGSASAAGSSGEAGEMGFHWIRQGQFVGAEYGLSLSAYRSNGITLPMFNFDAGIRLRPSHQWHVQPYGTAGLGVSFLLIVPLPSVNVGVGVQVPLGPELALEGALRVRQLLDLYTETQGVTVGTFEMGLVF